MFLSRKYQWLLIAACLSSSTSWAQTSVSDVQVDLFGNPYCLMRFHSVFSHIGGYVAVNPAHENHHYVGSDSDQFVYTHNRSKQNTGLAGIFAGAEWQIPCTCFINRFGLEYDYIWPVQIHGNNWVGIQPNTATPYVYQYHQRTQQVLAIARLLFMASETYRPYGMIGLGAAFNRVYGFTTHTSQQGSINLAPTFQGNTETSFAYSLGIGVEMNFTPHISLGVGYRFSDFGKSSFDHGQVNINNYHARVPFSLSNNHSYANQLIVDLNYFV